MLRKPEECTVEKIVDFLNDLIKTDKDCISRLMQLRMACNEAMENHPTVQVGDNGGAKSALGLLGIINGFFGTISDGPYKDHGPVTMLRAKDGTIINFVDTIKYFKSKSE